MKHLQKYRNHDMSNLIFSSKLSYITKHQHNLLLNTKNNKLRDYIKQVK